MTGPMRGSPSTNLTLQPARAREGDVQNETLEKPQRPSADEKTSEGYPVCGSATLAPLAPDPGSVIA
jgi:hypothetical protein